MGRVTYDGKVKHPVTAHPKVDPETGEQLSRHVAFVLRHTLSSLLPPIVAVHDCCKGFCCNTGESAVNVW